MIDQKMPSSELKRLIDLKEVVVIDVRTLTEFEEGHIWGALNFPIESLPGSLRDISKSNLITTVCNKGGGRSEKAAEILNSNGWTKSHWLEGGYLGWIKAGFPDYEPGFTSS